MAASIGIILNRKNGDNRLRSYSLVVVARNEEENLPLLLASLSKIDYPAGMYEIILVDDNSSDETYNIMQEMADKYENVRTIRITEKTLPGKKEGLQSALETAEKEILLMTDADCIVKPDWLHTYNYYWDDKTTLIAGYAPETGLKRSIAGDFRRFIGLVAAGVYAATIGLKIPFSCAGRNLAIKREELINRGGYKSMTVSKAGDDKELINLIRTNGGKIKYNSHKSVFTFPETRSFHEQQKRRFGIIKLSSPLHITGTLAIMAFYLYLPVYLLISKDFSGLVLFYTTSLLIWVVNLLKHQEPLYFIDFVFVLVYPYYFIFYTVLGTSGRWRWKE